MSVSLSFPLITFKAPSGLPAAKEFPCPVSGMFLCSGGPPASAAPSWQRWPPLTCIVLAVGPGMTLGTWSITESRALSGPKFQREQCRAVCWDRDWDFQVRKGVTT